jgi:hypothetical protein
MGRHNVKSILKQIEKIEFQIYDPSNKDDPRWLNRIAIKMKKWEIKKEKAIEHKQNHKKKEYDSITSRFL